MSVGLKGMRPYLMATRQAGALAGNSNNGWEETERIEILMAAAVTGMDPVQQTLHLMGQVLQQQQQQLAWQLALEESWI